MDDSLKPPPQRSTLAAYLQLVRLPNVFMAVTDVVMGYLFTHAVLQPGDSAFLGLLVVTSALLYMAGMVLNDVFDVEIDTQERPQRPIPSGRVSLGTARIVGWQLLTVGVVTGWLVSFRVGDLRPAVVATVLAGSVLLYDGLLKRTPIGPLGMGACRMLNVLLGMSLASGPWQGVHWLVAAAVGLYIAGVTWFSRGETGRSHRGFLVVGMLVILLSVGLLSLLPDWTEGLKPILQQQPLRWVLLMAVFAMVIGLRCLWAIAEPTPVRVQMVVRQSLLSLVVLNAALSFAVAGPLGAVAILVLLIPASWLGRWFYST